MECSNVQLDAHLWDVHLLSEVVDQAAKIVHANRACVLFHDTRCDQFVCMNREKCPCFKDACGYHGVVPFREAPEACRQFFNGHDSTGFVTLHQGFPVAIEQNEPRVSAQMFVPLVVPGSKPAGVLILESHIEQHFHDQDLAIVQPLLTVGLLAMQTLAEREKMISKLGLLSAANNVLLTEFENRPLSAKLDHVVEKTTEILDAELCSLWLVKDEKICLETSYSQEGKRIRKRVAWPIRDGLRSGMTGYLAFHKKVLNAWGDPLENHPAINPNNPVDFLDSQKVYSELAYPVLDGENLLGLLIAYNKLGPDGKPIRNAGFSKELDEPLMKVLATKLLISIKNAALLKKLKDYELIVESTPDPVVICSRKGWITYMNPGAKTLFGDLTGRHVAAHYPTNDDSQGIEKAREIKRELLKARDRRLRNYETTFLDRTGEAIPLSLSVGFIYDEHGNEAGTIGIAKDLREIKALLAAGQALIETHDIEKILHHITQVGLRLPKSIRSYIKQYDEKTDTLVFRALSSRVPGDKFPVASTPKEQGMTGGVFMEQQPLLSNDVPSLPLGRYNRIFSDVKSKLAVPITYIDKETGKVKKLGVISVDSDELNAFSNKDIYFLNTLANQAAVALENANLIASKNTIIARLRAFDRVQQVASGKIPNTEQIFESVLDAVVTELGFQYATISRVDPTTRMIGTVTGRYVPQEFLDRAWHSLDSNDIQALVARHKKPVYLTGWDEHLDREIYEKFDHGRLVRTIIPIIARGDVLGTLETGYDKSHKTEIAQDEIEALQRIVNLAGIGIEQANLLSRLKQDLALRNELEKQLEALNQASIEIFNATTEEEAVEHIFTSLKSIGYSKGMLSLINETTQVIEGCYAAGDNWRAIVNDTRRDLNGRDILAQAIRTQSALLSSDCEKDSRCDSAAIRKAGIKSQYVIPLIVKEKPIGTLQIDLSNHQDLLRGEEPAFRRRMNVVETFARQVAVAIRNIRALLTIDQQEAIIAETAHEFRSPLHNIMTEVGSLKDSLGAAKSDSNLVQTLGVIEEEILRAKRQMDNTLLLSDRTREKLEFALKPGLLQNVIETCVSAYRLRALDRGLRFIIKDSVKHLPRIEFDRDRMEQAFTNLIDNAVKYSHFNQYVTFNGFDDGTQINIDIADRGLGIPPDEFENIFQGFMRSETRDKMRYIPGTGLGLKITREIIRKHGGEIKVVRSEPLSKNPQKVKEFQDYLITFRVTLPKKVG